MRSTNSFNIEMSFLFEINTADTALVVSFCTVTLPPFPTVGRVLQSTTIMAFLRLCLLVLGTGVGQVLSMNDPNWLLSGIGVAALTHEDRIPPQAQVIDQRAFNVLHIVRPASEAHGYAVSAREMMHALGVHLG
jgi:hypothetical protein